MPAEQTIHREDCRKEEQGNYAPETFSAVHGHCQRERNRGGGSAAKHALERGQVVELKM